MKWQEEEINLYLKINNIFKEKEIKNKDSYKNKSLMFKEII
jgi:hypothetical protein